MAVAVASPSPTMPVADTLAINPHDAQADIHRRANAPAVASRIHGEHRAAARHLQARRRAPSWSRTAVRAHNEHSVEPMRYTPMLAEGHEHADPRGSEARLRLPLVPRRPDQRCRLTGVSGDGPDDIRGLVGLGRRREP